MTECKYMEIGLHKQTVWSYVGSRFDLVPIYKRLVHEMLMQHIHRTNHAILHHHFNIKSLLGHSQT